MTMVSDTVDVSRCSSVTPAPPKASDRKRHRRYEHDFAERHARSSPGGCASAESNTSMPRFREANRGPSRRHFRSWSAENPVRSTRCGGLFAHWASASRSWDRAAAAKRRSSSTRWRYSATWRRLVKRFVWLERRGSTSHGPSMRSAGGAGASWQLANLGAEDDRRRFCAGVSSASGEKGPTADPRGRS